MSEELATKNEEKSKPGAHQQQRWLRPRYDVREKESGDYLLRVWMPGVCKDGVNISLEKDTLEITGHRVAFRKESWRPVLQELPEGDYHLSLALNMRIDGERIKAQVENGILSLDLPLAEEAKPRQITIN